MRIPLESVSKESCTGNVHSFESMGTVDGPGIRFVVFMAGCPLRCKYCHNIDVVLGNGQPYTVEQLMQKIRRSKPYFKSSNGGVTLTGGDPIMQPDFVAALFSQCREEGIHTCLDTSLLAPPSALDTVLPVTDLFMVSVKHMDSAAHQSLTGAPNTRILQNLRDLSSRGARLWLRYLLLPGFTDTEENIATFAAFANELSYEKIELLPYHTVGKAKWEALGKDYALEDIVPPTQDEVETVRDRLESKGCTVVINEYE